MRSKEQWTKRCSDGRACAPIDYIAFQKLGKRAQQVIAKENFKGFRFLDRTNFIPENYDVCDDCLEAMYELDSTYDALDHLGMDKLYRADNVMKALRQARANGSK